MVVMQWETANLGNVPEWVLSAGRISPACCHALEQLLGCLSVGSLVVRSCSRKPSLCFTVSVHMSGLKEPLTKLFIKSCCGCFHVLEQF